MERDREYEEKQQEHTGDGRNHQRPGRQWFRSLTGILAVVFLVVSITLTGLDYWGDKKRQNQYEKLAQEVQQEQQTTAAEIEKGTEEVREPYVAPVDFETLAQINPDVIGWIRIPDTGVDYPVVWTDNNETYLSKSFEGEASRAGAIYLDFESEPDFSGRHNIIYGHHMRDGSMFAEIVNYKDEEYLKAHPDIYIYTPDREIHLKVMAALYTDASGIRRKTKFADDESFQAYVDQMTEGCLFRQLPEEPVETLYSLVTCSYEFDDARTILYAYEAGEEEEAQEEKPGALTEESDEKAVNKE